MRKSILFLFAIVCAAFMAAQEQLYGAQNETYIED